MRNRTGNRDIASSATCMRAADCVFHLRIPDPRAAAWWPRTLSIDPDHCAGRRVKYHRCGGGKIETLYFAHDETFGAPPGRLRLGGSVVSSDCRYTRAGQPGRYMGWVFARNTDMGSAVYRSLLVRFAERGDGASRFRDVVQKPERIGLAGYQ
jgi:hypothetical protein